MPDADQVGHCASSGRPRLLLARQRTKSWSVGDRRMTQAEIGLAIANRGQPRYDVEPVPEAGLADLDGAALARTLERVRDTSRSLRDVDDGTALRRIRVLVPNEDGQPVPSVAGILTAPGAGNSSTIRWRRCGKQSSMRSCTATTAT